MISSNLVTNEEVGRDCKSLGIKDWSIAPKLTVSADEARAILQEVGGEAKEVGLEDFREGRQVELEHGTRFPDANVTNCHPVLTGKIVLAHLKESLLNYKRLAVAELEGDLHKATEAHDADKLRSVYERIVSARLALDQAEVRFLAGKWPGPPDTRMRAADARRLGRHLRVGCSRPFRVLLW